MTAPWRHCIGALSRDKLSLYGRLDASDKSHAPLDCLGGRRFYHVLNNNSFAYLKLCFENIFLLSMDISLDIEHYGW